MSHLAVAQLPSLQPLQGDSNIVVAASNIQNIHTARQPEAIKTTKHKTQACPDRGVSYVSVWHLVAATVADKTITTVRLAATYLNDHNRRRHLLLHMARRAL